jgi:hypothetical protein
MRCTAIVDASVVLAFCACSGCAGSEWNGPLPISMRRAACVEHRLNLVRSRNLIAHAGVSEMALTTGC